MKATYRWLGRQIAAICSPGMSYDNPCHWVAKARKVAAAQRTISGVHAAIVNFPWMADRPASALEVAQYERILEAMSGKSFCENL